MTKDHPKCLALAARQQKVYLAMRRTGKHLLDGKQYVPATTKPQPLTAAMVSNVAVLRRKA